MLLLRIYRFLNSCHFKLPPRQILHVQYRLDSLFVCAHQNGTFSEISLSLLALLREDMALVSLMSSYLAGTGNLESLHSPSVGFHLSHFVCPPDFQYSGFCRTYDPESFCTRLAFRIRFLRPGTLLRY